jgi:GAF domain-containing protein
MKKNRPTKSQLDDLFADVVLPEPVIPPRQASDLGAEPAREIPDVLMERLLTGESQPFAPDMSVAQDKSRWRQRLERWLTVPTDDPDLAREGRTIGRLLIPSLVVALAATGLFSILLLGGASFPALVGLGVPISGGIVSLLSFVLVKRGQVRVGIRLYVVGIFVGCLVLAYAGHLSLGIALYILWAITLGGLLLEPIYALWMAFAATGVTIFLFVLQDQEVYQPLIIPTRRQETLLNLSTWNVIFVTIGVLIYLVANNLNRVLQQERALRTELVTQQNALAREVARRTDLLQKTNYQLQKRAIHLEASAQVSQAAASTLDPQELMQITVDLIRTQFNYYHVSFFLLDEAGEWAIVRASTGEIGRKMVAQPHRLAVGGESMVGWVCEHRRPRITLDVGADAVHFDHPWLPSTRSEITLPLHVGDKLLGALDVQSTEEAAFDDDDLRTLQGMADLVAIALENAHLFASTRQGTRHQNLVARLTDRVQKATSVTDILEAAVKDLGETFDLAEAVICLGTEAELRTDGKGRTKIGIVGETPSRDTE